MMGAGGSGGRAATSRRFVRTGFALVALGVVVSTTFALVQTGRLENDARDIVDDMLTSIRLVGRIENLEGRRRILVDDHIFAKERGEMERLETEITATEAEIARASSAYERWAVLPGEPEEQETWQRARADAARLDAPVGRALALSRANRDGEARRVMTEIRAAFAHLSDDLDRLIVINDQAATESRQRFGMTRDRLMVTLGLIGVVGLLGTLAVGRWATREVAEREDTLALNARLLETRNRELDAFASRVAHDIRGPLTSLNLVLEPISGRLPSEDRSIRVARRATQRMGALVDDLLTLARSSTRVPGRCDPAQVVAVVQEDFGARIRDERGTLRVSLDHADVACSEGLLIQALLNLLDNAFKYRRREVEPEVVISGAVSDGGYDLRVSDNGVGMSKDEASHLFEPFYRAPSVIDRPGVGLGLSIVHRVAEASGGTMSVETAPGRGSTFVMHLRLAS
jgi:two-component system, OmpR family, sensor kinase